MNKGFTLIEMLIYIALFSIIMVGLISGIYLIIQNAGKTTFKVGASEEINFVLKKIDWALTNASKINTPTSGSSATLSIDQYDFADNPIVIRYNSDTGDVEFQTNGGTFYPLTTKNVKVNSLSFTYIPSNSGSPEGIQAKLSINNMSDTIVKYLRK